jgi:hypothetical protein
MRRSPGIQSLASAIYFARKEAYKNVNFIWSGNNDAGEVRLVPVIVMKRYNDASITSLSHNPRNVVLIWGVWVGLVIGKEVLVLGLKEDDRPAIGDLRVSNELIDVVGVALRCTLVWE